MPRRAASGRKTTDADALLRRTLSPLAMDGGDAMRLDSLITIAVIRFTDHVHSGRIDPRAVGFALDATHASHDVVPLIRTLATAESVPAAIDAIEPRQSRFRDLERALAALRASGADAAQVEKVELAMERWRWLPDMRASRFIVVNIPAFRLYAFDLEAAGERPVEKMDVIVGSAYSGRHTPRLHRHDAVRRFSPVLGGSAEHCTARGSPAYPARPRRTPSGTDSRSCRVRARYFR